MEEDIVIRTLAHIATGTFRTGALLLKFLTLRICDVFCLLCNVLAVCTIIRIPAICYVINRKWNQGPGRPQWIELWRFLGILQVGIFIVDIPFLLMCPLLLVFFWRAVLLLQEHGPIQYGGNGWEYGYAGWNLRKLIWKHFCLLCTDFFFIPFSLCLSLSWRSIRFRRQLREQFGDEVRWKKMIVKEFVMLLNEIVCFPIIGLMMISWRSKDVRELIRRVTHVSEQSSDIQVMYSLTQINRGDAFFCEWYVIIGILILLSADIVTLPLLVLLLLSWRSQITWRIFKPWYLRNIAINTTGPLPEFDDMEIIRRIWSQFFKGLVVDIFHLPFLLPVLFSWQIFFFYKSVMAIFFLPMPTDNQQQERTNSSIDTYRRSQELLALDIRLSKVREKILLHCLRLITDVICLLAFVVILLLTVVFPWRLYKVVTSIWREAHLDTPISEKFVKSCIFKEFMFALVDIPTSIAGLVICATGWRLPFVISDAVAILNNDRPERKSLQITNCIHRNLWLLMFDFMVAPFVVLTVFTVWRLKPFIQSIKDSKKPCDVQHWHWFLASYDGRAVRKSAVITTISLIFIDVPCLCMLLINTVCIIRLPAILSSLLNCSSFYSEYPVVLITETLNLLVDLLYISFGIVLFILRPIAVVVHLLEDEKHRKARELNESIATVCHVLRKAQGSKQQLEEMVNILIKSYSSSDNKFCKFLLSKIVVDHSADMEYLKLKLMDRYVDDKFIYLMTKYLFLFDKHAHFMYRRYLIEKFHLKRPSYYARLQNLDLFHQEYAVYLKKLKETESELLEFEVEEVPLWKEKIGFFNRSRKENQAVLVKTLATGNFATLIVVILNFSLVYRAIPLIRQIISEPFLIRKKAVKNLEQYWLDLRCLGQIIIVVLSIYRCPDLISDLIVDIFYKRSVTAIRSTAAFYPPQVKKDVGKVLSLLFKWRTVAYLIASTLFFCFIPLSAIINAGKTFSQDQRRVFGGSLLLYLLIILMAVGIIFEKIELMISTQHQLFEYLCLIFAVLVLFVGASSKKQCHLPPVDYVRVNWGLIHMVLHEMCQLGQILSLLFRLAPAIDGSRMFHSIFKIFFLETDDPNSNLTLFNYMFYFWFLVSSAPVILEGVLKYVPEGRFSNNNFSWQFILSLFGSTTFVVIPYLGSSYLCSSTEEGLLAWSGEPGKAAWCLMFMVWYLLTSILFYCRYFNTANPLSDLQFSPIYNSIINMVKLALVILTVFLDVDPVLKMSILLVSVIFMAVITAFYPNMIACVSSLENEQPCNSGLLKTWRLSTYLTLAVILLLSLVSEFIPTLSASCGTLIPMVIGGMIVTMAANSWGVTPHSANVQARETFIDIVKGIEQAMQEKDKGTCSWSKTRRSWLNLLKVVRVANELDKKAEQVVENIFVEEDEENEGLTETAPPTYEQVSGDKNVPPSYEAINTFGPPKDFVFESDFVPDMDYLTTPVGSWHPYSASHQVKELSYLSGFCENLTQTITDQKCTGSHILLILEKHIHYTALKRNCVQKLSVWRALVAQSDWVGLVKYAKMLKGALTLDYETPTQIGIITNLVDDDFLKPLADDSFFPDYVETESLFEIKLKVHKQRRGALLSILPSKMSQLFAKLIPENHPMLNSITEDCSSEVLNVTCKFFKNTKISIVSVPGQGFKVAAGALLQVPKTLKIIEISDDFVAFGPPYPVASKSFLSTNIQMFKTFEVNEVVRIGISNDVGKTAEFSKVLDTLSDLHWK